MAVALQNDEVELNAEETELAAKIEFDGTELMRLEYAERIANGEAVLRLLRMLTARGAIPLYRLKTFTDADHYPGGRKKSLQEIFQGNGTSGDDIARHGNFLRVMRYFVFGPNLPTAAKVAFARAINDAGGEITGSEVIEVSKAARQITRIHRIPAHEAAEEFFKLALEHGAHPMWAKMIYESVRAVKPAR